MNRGLFISFEGPEAVGKTTQLELLAEHLRAHRLPVITTREPGSETAIGPKMREFLLHSKENIAPITELLLFFAERAQHVEELIRPAVEEGQIVLCDRYLESTLAYQGWGRGFNFPTIRELHKIATGNYMPDLTFIFTGKPFRDRGDDRLEKLDSEFHQRVSRAYALMAHHDSLRKRHYRHIDANRPIEVIAKEIIQHVDQVRHGRG